MCEHGIPNEFASKAQYPLGMGYYYEYITGVDMRVESELWIPPLGRSESTGQQQTYINNLTGYTYQCYIRQSYKVKYAETNSPS